MTNRTKNSSPKKLFLSEVLLSTPVSPIRKLVPFAQAAKKRGIKVYHLNIGDPDIKTPQAMMNTLKNWSQNPIRYINSQGLEELLIALVGYYQKLGFKISTNNLQITSGGSEAILWSLMAIASLNEEIIVFEPFYANYNGFAAMAQTRLVPVKTTIKNGFHLPSKPTIIKKITAKTRAILITNPNNPTGTVYTKKELQTLVEIAKKYNLYLISDETYREFCYDGKSAISCFGFQKQIPNQIIIIDSLSKRYSLCGARIGYILTDNKILLSGFLKFAQTRLSVGHIDQLIASKLTKVKNSYFKKNITEYQKRRDIVYNGLKRTKGVICPNPEGAFYAVVKLPVTNAEHFAKWLLTDFNDKGETIMVAPAAGFYATPNLGKNQVRIAYVINQKDLKRAIKILKRALGKYKSEQAEIHR